MQGNGWPVRVIDDLVYGGRITNEEERGGLTNARSARTTVENAISLNGTGQRRALQWQKEGKQVSKQCFSSIERLQSDAIALCVDRV